LRSPQNYSSPGINSSKQQQARTAAAENSSRQKKAASDLEEDKQSGDVNAKVFQDITW